MEPNATEDHAEQKSPTRNRPSKKQLSTPSVLPRLHVRPWWFPEQELSDPLVLYIESWLADVIFGPNQSLLPELEWISQALVTMDIVDSGNLAEITIFGRPAVKNRLKIILLNLVAWHKENRHIVRAMKMKEREELLKSSPSNSNNLPEPVQKAPAD
ncbi:oocyte-expressed protein homolog [Cricetulus griseus]|uniref:Oocyte-expressed protein homolog n=1 Tax=Cricetulus griseus TaxID=10029 RepID=A0A061I2U0_CRIGR|nr:oocyte-expressed protein homolog [Cricetulus griseus]XP_027267197.1 oocyte-expressed protein homolog [Cricetulus griseus]ERE74965.1 putative oocyte [Cricetulus griseus]